MNEWELGEGKKVIWARCWRLMNFFWWQKVIAKLNVAVFTHFDTMNDSNCKLNEYFSITCSWAISFFFVLVIFCIFKACFWRSFKQEEKQMPLRAARPLLKWLYFCFVSSKNPLLKEFQRGRKTVVITSYASIIQVVVFFFFSKTCFWRSLKQGVKQLSLRAVRCAGWLIHMHADTSPPVSKV